jgi:hypothetical protein
MQRVLHGAGAGPTGANGIMRDTSQGIAGLVKPTQPIDHCICYFESHCSTSLPILSQYTSPAIL